MSTSNFKLGEIAEFTNGGAWNQSAYTPQGIPVVRVSDIHNYTVDLADCKYLDPCLIEQYSKHELREGDLVICTVGSHPTQPNSVVGRPGIMPKSCNGALLNQNAVCIRPSTLKLDKEWLSFFARSQYMKDYIIAHARGSASQVRVSIGALKDMPVPLPRLEDQITVASTLKKYDKLIENNNRRIAILEEIAQSLYREWFVKFRFPGHEQCQMVDSPLGMIPDGWSCSSIGEWYSVKSGFAFKSKQMQDEESDFGIIKIKNINESGLDVTNIQHISSEHINDKAKTFLLREADTLIAMTGAQVGKVSFVPKAEKPLLQNQRVGRFTAQEEGLGFGFLWQLINSSYFQTEVVNRAQGAAQPNISAKDLEGIACLLPIKDLVQRFESFADPLGKQIRILQSKNLVLKKQRDLLLPILISGQIEL